MKSEKEIFYDTDCLSCFISIDDVSILKKLFKKVIIPYEVHKEFSRIDVLKNRIDTLIHEGFVEVVEFDTSSKTYEFYRKLCKGEVTGRIIGEGEAAAITLAIENNGILASTILKMLNKPSKSTKLKESKPETYLLKLIIPES